MLSKLGALIIFDLENCVYLAKNELDEMICRGELDNAFRFKAPQISPHVIDTINARIIREGFLPVLTISVVSKESKELINGFIGCKCRITKNQGFNNGPGSQAADIEIRKILDHLYTTLPTEIPVIMVSGDGGFISSMKKLKEKGHRVAVVSPEWGINGGFYSDLGEDHIIPLPPSWIKEILRSTIKHLPHAE